MTFIWLWVGARSRRCRSRDRPAAAARASAPRRPSSPREKSRRRATGHSSTTSFGEYQRGRSRRLASVHQRRTSSNTSHGAAPRASGPGPVGGGPLGGEAGDLGAGLDPALHQARIHDSHPYRDGQTIGTDSAPARPGRRPGESEITRRSADEQDRRTQRSPHTLRQARRRPSSVDATELGGTAIEAALERAEVKPEQVQHVVMGQVLQAGQGQIPSRQAQIKAGIPKEVSSETVNKVCASSLRAVGMIDQAVRAGDLELAVAGGMESMSRAPYLLPKAPLRLPHGRRQGARRDDPRRAHQPVHGQDDGPGGLRGRRGARDDPRGPRHASRCAATSSRSRPPTRAGSRRRSRR